MARPASLLVAGLLALTALPAAAPVTHAAAPAADPAACVLAHVRAVWGGPTISSCADPAAFAVAPDADPPRVAIAAPARGVVRPGAALEIAASDASSGVAAVQVRACRGGACSWDEAIVVGVDTAAPFAVAWSDRPAAGTYTLLARARDNAGNTAASAPATVKVATKTPAETAASPAVAGVAADTTAPTVALTAPGADATLRRRAKLAAAASDDVGVARVAFQARPAGGGPWTTLGAARRAPYQTRVDLTDLEPGSYQVRAVAVDAAGNRAASAPSPVTVAAPPAPQSAASQEQGSGEDGVGNGGTAEATADGGEVTVDVACEDDSCDIEIHADGGTATCDASGGSGNRVEAPPDADVSVGEDGTCQESEEGGTVEVGDIP